MPATFTITRRNLSIALTVSLPAAAMCVAVLGSPPAHSAAPAMLHQYRAPSIAMVQPGAGGAIPQDRPVVVFRFAPGEPGDPIDAASFTVMLDGEDRTAGFHISSSEGWGSLAVRTRESALPLGSHSLEARICSVRGACAATSTAIVVHRGMGRRVW
jgi:hypothetical protein